MNEKNIDKMSKDFVKAITKPMDEMIKDMGHMMLITFFLITMALLGAPNILLGILFFIQITYVIYTITNI